jgi:hypothetical protein
MTSKETRTAFEPKIVWQYDMNAHCAGCGRAPYRRRDGREYLYRYRENGPAVCKPRCDSGANS